MGRGGKAEGTLWGNSGGIQAEQTYNTITAGTEPRSGSSNKALPVGRGSRHKNGNAKV